MATAQNVSAERVKEKGQVGREDPVTQTGTQHLLRSLRLTRWNTEKINCLGIKLRIGDDCIDQGEEQDHQGSEDGKHQGWLKSRVWGR